MFSLVSQPIPSSSKELDTALLLQRVMNHTLKTKPGPWLFSCLVTYRIPENFGGLFIFNFEIEVGIDFMNFYRTFYAISADALIRFHLTGRFNITNTALTVTVPAKRASRHIDFGSL